MGFWRAGSLPRHAPVLFQSSLDLSGGLGTTHGTLQCQVEDWLKLIRLRVGADASVIIVSTHCSTGERIARIDRPVFERDFGSMIAGFHEVDSLTYDPATGERVGIAKLKQMIAGVAGNLEQMG